MCLRLAVVEMLLLVVANAAVATTQLAQTKPDCPTKCGDLEIKYPFGTEPRCYLDKSFLITCNNTYSPPKPFYWNSNLEVTSITMEGGLQFQSLVSRSCYDAKNNVEETYLSVGDSISISDTQNKFTVIGCDSYGYINGTIDGKAYREGCVAWCDSLDNDITEGDCSGSACCQIDIPKGLQQITVEAHTFDNKSRVNDELKRVNPCSYAFVIEDSQFNFSVKNLSNMSEEVPTAVDWAITGQGKCKEAVNNQSYACNKNASCYDPPAANNSADGYLCKCKGGYEGNPYLPEGGCQDVDECKQPNHTCHKKAHCINTLGSYECKCNKGYRGDGRKSCVPPNELRPEILVGVILGFVILLLISSSWVYFMLKKRRLIKLKEKFFQQNGGYLLQQELSKRDGPSDRAKIFSEKELKQATNNFDDKRIIGRGGYGIVYKGFLIDNNQVAIKKAKVVDQSQIEQFINEIIVLSQINHRNVVKLLGCCLETEVPSLVYEYVNNGTLFDHIHNKYKTPTISWETRLRIAAETAEVLSYLHSAASTPIIHRDVKSTNILLDDNFTTKVSDFGASKLVPMDETQISTMVRGTLGYLDPEYLHTSQLTEKSDVYSFGVILVELMTGKKVVSFDRPEEERSLVTYFLFLLKKGTLFEILENSIINDDNIEQIMEVAELARSCLRVKGEERPTMKEVAIELEGLRRRRKHLWDNVQVDIEETKHLNFEMSYSCNTGDNCNSTIAYDSMKDQVIVPSCGHGGR